MSYILPVKLDKGSGAPLVLLHGLGNNYKSWSFVLEHIDYTKWRVIALDLLGFGDAPKPDVAYTPEDHAKAVMATLDSLGLDRAVFAGHSMGCIVAIELASRWPDRVERLALFGAPVYKAKPRRSLLQRVFRAERGYFSLFEVVKKHPEAVQAAVDHFVARGCTIHEPVTNTGGDMIVATVKKPNGQLLGLIYNPYFKGGVSAI